MDGLNFKISGDPLSEYFTVDKYGSYIPNPGNLLLDKVSEGFRKQSNARTGFSRRLASIYERTDGQFTNNPLGNTPTMGVGFSLFGPRPLKPKKRENQWQGRGHGQNVDKELEKREKKIEDYQLESMALHASLEPDPDDKKNHLLWQVEGDQVMTGGGFDNNSIGEVHRSGLNFIIDSSTPIDYEDTELSQIVVEGCLWLRDHLQKEGMVLGSLQPVGASVVRSTQDKDGMLGYPVFGKGNAALTADVAKRLLIESGVDTTPFIGKKVTDSTTGVEYPYRNIDAGGYILDNRVWRAQDLHSLVVLLARIQKHGWKMDNGKLVAKNGKTRSVYPNAFLPSIIEGMAIDPFNKKMQELKVSMMPSLQDKPTRVDMIRRQIVGAISNDYDYLAADWSKYDATVRGSILATIIQLVVKPFFKAEYYKWLDMVTYLLTYKYLIMSTDFCSMWPDMYAEAKGLVPNVETKKYQIFGLTNGLISGAKFTHVGGSLYGEVVVHYGIARLMGYEPIIGAQAGDDTLMGIRRSYIDVSSVEKTYTPIFKNAARFGLRANVDKQIWFNVDGEVVKVFLQDTFHAATEIWGIGSTFRPDSSVLFSEHEKNLTVQEQLLAQIARQNQGADNPFVAAVVEKWLSKERYLGWLFKEHGVNGFRILIDSIGNNINDIIKRIDVGSFTFGVVKGDIEAGTLPILPIMADVARQMTFSSEDEASFVTAYNLKAGDNSEEVDEYDTETTYTV